MTETPNPSRIEWSGPEGWTVWADEDGCHIRTPRAGALEQCDVERLFALWTSAKSAHAAGSIPAPRPLSREERQANRREWHEAAIARRVIRVVKDEFGPTPTDQPF